MPLERYKIKIIEKPLSPLFRTVKNPVYSKIGDVLKDGENITKYAKKCNACGLNTGNSTIAPTFVKSPKAIFIGRNPGQAEAFYGDIFDTSTKSGAVFRAYLEALGLTPPEVYVTNVCHCSTPQNRPLLEEEVKKCCGWKIAEFKNMDLPEHIFLMGQDALKLFYGTQHPTILSILGDIYVSEWEGKKRYFYPILHPAYICRDKEWAKSAFNILTIANKIMKGE